MKKLVALMAFTVVLAGMASAVQDSEDQTVSVSVSSVVSIDVSPDSLTYSSVAPGAKSTTSDTGYTSIEIENLGSENITTVWANTSMPSSNPFGSGTSGAYDAGNFIQINPDAEISGVQTDNYFTYVNRREYNETNTLSYVFRPSSGTYVYPYGRFKEGDEEFFWMIQATKSEMDTGTGCDGDTNEELWVGKNPHTDTSLGSVDFTTASNYWKYNITTSGVTGVGLAKDINISTNEGTKTYSVHTHCEAGSSNKVWTTRTKFNAESEGDTNVATSSGTAAQNVLASSTQDEELQPGEHFSVKTRVLVPQGVAQGSVTAGKLRIFAVDT